MVTCINEMTFPHFWSDVSQMPIEFAYMGQIMACEGIFQDCGLQRPWDLGLGPNLKTKTAIRAQDLGQATQE